MNRIQIQTQNMRLIQQRHRLMQVKPVAIISTIQAIVASNIATKFVMTLLSVVLRKLLATAEVACGGQIHYQFAPSSTGGTRNSSC